MKIHKVTKEGVVWVVMRGDSTPFAFSSREEARNTAKYLKGVEAVIEVPCKYIVGDGLDD